MGQATIGHLLTQTISISGNHDTIVSNTSGLVGTCRGRGVTTVEAMGLFRKHKQPGPQRVLVETVERVPVTLPTPPAGDESGRRTVADQASYLASSLAPLPAFGMYLLDAWGSAVCEDIVAEGNHPADDVATVHGYALSTLDLSDPLPEGGQRFPLLDGETLNKAHAAIRVAPGRVMPVGADAVVPAGGCELDADDRAILVHAAVAPGDNVRWAGSDIRSGSILMRSGERLNARRSMQLALAGIDRVLARPRPRVVVLAIGDQEGVVKIDSHLLAALVKADGAQVWRVVVPTDTEVDLGDLISDQLIRADLVLAIGSLEPDSELLSVLTAMGAVDVADTAQRPGGRIGFALVGEDAVPVLMVPEAPVAAYLAYQLYARQMINRLAGAKTPPRRTQNCLIGGDLTSSPGIHEVCFATIRTQAGEKVAVPLGGVGATRLSDMVNAEAVIVLDENTTSLALGDRADCWLLDD